MIVTFENFAILLNYKNKTGPSWISVGRPAPCLSLSRPSIISTTVLAYAICFGTECHYQLSLWSNNVRPIITTFVLCPLHHRNTIICTFFFLCITSAKIILLDVQELLSSRLRYAVRFRRFSAGSRLRHPVAAGPVQGRRDPPPSQSLTPSPESTYALFLVVRWSVVVVVVVCRYHPKITHNGRHGRGDETFERQETDPGRRVRGPGEFPGNRHSQPHHTRCGQETVHRLRSAHESEFQPLRKYLPT